MRYLALYGFLGLFFLSCSQVNPLEKRNTRFSHELEQLQSYFSIPGLSAVITKDGHIVYENYLGYSNIEHGTKVDSLTAFPIASITKLFSATLTMKLVEQNRLSLNDPVQSYGSDFSFGDSILVKHILSHTSQGAVGTSFLYSSRFGYLTPIIEQASGTTFKDAVENEILKPLNLDHTFLLKDSTQLTRQSVNLASPYMLEDTVTPGFIDYGYSASAGLVSTARDLARFDQALDVNSLISASSRNQMFTGLREELPYAYGIFSQEIEGLRVYWVYGQYDSYSSLLLKVPEQNLTLILLANNNLMSDPARLIMGDVTSSLFAHSFLKNYVFGRTEIPLFEEPDAAFASGYSDYALYRSKILAQALASSFMARYDTSEMKNSEHLLNKTFEAFPDYLSYGDINVLHTLGFLKTVAFYRDLGEFRTFDTHIERIGKHLIQEYPFNPYTHVYMGTFYDRNGEIEKARHHYREIVEARNFSPNWYTAEAKSWLNDHP